MLNYLRPNQFERVEYNAISSRSKSIADIQWRHYDHILGCANQKSKS